jgi:CheY-like chemotaxis protein
MIFMDIQMPEMDGYEATRKIRDFERGASKKAVPIIAMTANVFREDVEKCLVAGMDGHVGKPLEMDEVLRTLRQYLA